MLVSPSRENLGFYHEDLPEPVFDLASDPTFDVS